MVGGGQPLFERCEIDSVPVSATLKLSIFYLQDRRWLCAESDRSDIETNETFSFPDLSDKQMIKIHNYLMKLQ